MSAKEIAVGTFDYSKVEPETKGKLVSLAGQIKRGREHYNKSVFELGESIATAQDLLANNKNGTFGKWIEAEAGLEETTARNYMNAWKAFRYSANIAGYAPSAMYLLAAPEAPKEAIKEAEKLASKGERISVKRAKQILDKLKSVSPPKPPKADPPKPQPAKGKEDAHPCANGHDFDEEACKRCHEPRPKQHNDSFDPAKLDTQKPPKNGKALFNDASVEELFRKLVRSFDDREQQVGGNAKLYKKCHDTIDVAYKAWKELARA
jgi:hypothetical protein